MGSRVVGDGEGVRGRGGSGAELRVREICNSIIAGLCQMEKKPGVWRESWVAIAGSIASPEEAENAEEAVAKTEAQTEPTREWLLQGLREILEIALEKVTNPKTRAAERIKWSRIVIAAGSACNSVLRDVEVDALKKEVAELKALTMERLREDDEDRADQTGEPEATEDG